MKILQIHNYYRSEFPSGENHIVDHERRILESNGHQVELISKTNDQWHSQRLKTALIAATGTLWNQSVYSEYKQYFNKSQFDVAHIHNTFPLFSPSIIMAAAHSGIPIVMTLHNFRLFCANGTLVRNNKRCVECMISSNSLRGMRYGCYRSSRLLSTPIALGLTLHRKIKTWEKHINAFIVMSEHQKNLVQLAGMPSSRIHVKPHAVSDPGMPLPWADRTQHVMFMGRLSPEKGIMDLLNAWKRLGPNAPKLKIVGKGVLEDQVKKFIKCHKVLPIQMLGQLDHHSALEHLRRSKLLVMPSRWDETFGLPIYEAFSAGVPVITSDVSHFPETIARSGAGKIFPHGNVEKLAAAVLDMWNDDGALCKHSEYARKSFLTHYSEKSSIETVQRIYGEAIKHKGISS